jgi:hypothetical protein
MGRQQPVGNERITQSMKAVTVHLTESGTTVDHTKTVIESVIGTERERKIRTRRTIGMEKAGNMRRTDTAQDMAEKIMTATDAKGRETVTIIVTAAAGTGTLDEIGKGNSSNSSHDYNCIHRDRRRESGRTRDKDRRSRDEMDWEDGYSRRPGSREREGQRARSGGPDSSLPDDRERERERDSGGKREADTDVEMERRATKVSVLYLSFIFQGTLLTDPI